jgi:hypothetical protein
MEMDGNKRPEYSRLLERYKEEEEEKKTGSNQNGNFVNKNSKRYIK